MEEELTEMNKLHEKEWKATDRGETSLDAEYMNILKDDEVEAAIDWMYSYVENPKPEGRKKRSKKAEPEVPEVKKFSAKYWPLIPWAIQDWRESDHRKRAFPKEARLALVHKHEVEQYRKALFSHSTAAQMLRNAFQEDMQDLCTKRTLYFSDRDDIRSHSTWMYARETWPSKH